MIEIYGKEEVEKHEKENEIAAMIAQNLWSVSSNIQLARSVQLLYTNISCIGNSHVRSNGHNAGWGAVMLNASGHISNPNDGSAPIAKRLWGPVITDHTHPSFLGALLLACIYIGRSIIYLSLQVSNIAPHHICYITPNTASRHRLPPGTLLLQRARWGTRDT